MIKRDYKCIPCIDHKLELAERSHQLLKLFYHEYTCHRKYLRNSGSDAVNKERQYKVYQKCEISIRT